MTSPLLDYVVATVPTPLATSSGGHVKIVVSNGGDKKVLCKLITVVVTGGDYAQDLLAKNQQPKTACAPDSKWSFTRVQDGVYIAEPEAEAVEFTPRSPSTTMAFKASPKTGENVDVSTEGVFLELFDFQVNSALGAAAITLIEDAKYDGEAIYQQRRTTLVVGKFHATEVVIPDPLPVTNFHADASSGQLVTAIKSGTSVKLSWNGPKATYSVQANGVPYQDKDIIDEGKGQFSCTIPKEILLRDTVFVLTAEKSTGGVKVYRHLSTGVLVTNPTLPSLRVNGLLEALQDFTVKQGSESVVCKLDTRGLTGVKIAGAIAPAQNNKLEIHGEITMPDTLNVSKQLNASGTIDLSVDVQTLDTPPKDPNATDGSLLQNYRATTDGILVCDINAEAINDADGNAYVVTFPKDHDGDWGSRVGASAYVKSSASTFDSCSMFIPANRKFVIGGCGKCSRAYYWISYGDKSPPKKLKK